MSKNSFMELQGKPFSGVVVTLSLAGSGTKLQKIDFGQTYSRLSLSFVYLSLPFVDRVS